MLTTITASIMKLPSGRNFILFISFDFDAESAEILQGKDPIAISRGRFGPKVGIWKVLNVLDQYGLKTTFFTPGWVIEKYPDVVKSIAEKGHEIALHGYLHERLDELKRQDEEKIFDISERAFMNILSYKPYGFRAPYWRWSENTLDILLSRNYLYDSSLMDSEDPYVLSKKGKRLVVLPIDWRLDDWPYLEAYRSISNKELLDMWIEEIEYAYRRRGYVSITMHPQCIGRGARIMILMNLISKALKLRAWIPRGVDIAKYILYKGSK
ncbi:MAG: polysaccharide deacetylase [Thermoprotei archaeon]|nr:polysaccharide deacetylase [Thermoprotei archaeon]